MSAAIFPATLRPDGANTRPAALSQRVARLIAPTSNQYVAQLATVPALVVTLHFALQSRGEVTALRDWFDTVAGRCHALWLPTFRADLTLATDAASTSTTVNIVALGYTDTYSTIEARRHLAFLKPDGTALQRRVESAVNNGDGTETLTLSSALGVTWPVGYGLISFLLYARLDDDTLRLTRYHGAAAEADLAFLELPQETPSA